MRETIRVAMLTRDYPPRVGGISTYVYELVSRLERIGVEFDVMVGGGDVKTLLLPLRGAVGAGDYDLVHVASLPYGAFVGFHPLVVTAHSPVFEEGKYYGFSNRLKRPWASFLEGRTARKADALIAVSQATAGKLDERYGVGKKVAVIPNGVDTSHFVPGRRSRSKILMCSRLDPRKNIGEALESLGKLKGPFEVEIVGDGPERQKLESVAARFGYPARFAGIVSDEQLWNAFASSEIFLSSSLSEGFGISVLQAMAAGCAVVVSDIPAHRELVTHMVDGMIYSNGTELVDYITLLLSDHGLAERLGTNAREKAKQYSWESVASRTKKVYLELISRDTRSF